jgi:hypothetical protein
MEVLGWSGVYFQPTPEDYARLSERLASRKDVRAVQAFLTPENANELFTQAAVPDEFDLLSIDIDGQDYWVWKGLDGFRPRVVVIEFNASLAGSRKVEKMGTVHQRFSSYFGASFDALRTLGEQKGYTLVYADLAGVNLFLVRNDLAGPFAEPLRRGPNYLLQGNKHPFGDGDYVEV